MKPDTNNSPSIWLGTLWRSVIYALPVVILTGSLAKLAPTYFGDPKWVDLIGQIAFAVGMLVATLVAYRQALEQDRAAGVASLVQHELPKDDGTLEPAAGDQERVEPVNRTSTAMAVPSRANCPCCGYPTLNQRSAYQICRLCNWEDDGQDDDDADSVRGGPNSDYSLSEARSNFKRYRVMYAPGRDQRVPGLIPGLDTPVAYATKGQLMAVLARICSCAPSEVKQLEAEIERLEEILMDEQMRAIEAFDQAHPVGP